MAARSGHRQPAAPNAAPLAARDFVWRGRGARAQINHEAYAALLKVVVERERELVEVLKTASLSPAQYNVLRVLRGAGPGGLTCGEVTGRLIRHDPDITRLNDRLERRGLIERRRETADRRVVRTRITRAGLRVLAELDSPVDALHQRQLGHMSERQLSELRVLVETIRARPPG